MWLQYFLEIFHFAVCLLASLVFFGVAWLYYDASGLHKNLREILKFFGFALLSIVYLLNASIVESVLVPDPFLGFGTLTVIKIFKIIALLLIIGGIFIDPLQDIPDRPAKKNNYALFLPLLKSAPLVMAVSFASPILTIVIAFLYLRRATIGLENHLKTVALSFYLLALSEIFTLAPLFIISKNVDIFNLVSPFGPLWIIQHLTLLAASLILLKWVFFYLFKRLETQLFFIYICSIVSIFLLTAVSFTSLLVRNVEIEAKSKLSTNVRVLDYALKSKLSQTLSDSQIVAQNPETLSGIDDISRLKLKTLTENILIAKKLDSLLVTDQNGQILMRGENSEQFGDSISADILFKRIMIENSVSGADLKKGILAPTVILKAGNTIKDTQSKIIGTVIAGNSIDNAFVDGIKKTTGLEATVYADNIISATTLTQTGSNLRLIGLTENNREIKDQVLKSNKPVTAIVKLAGTDYLASYLPIVGSDGNPIGMLQVGVPHISVLQTTGRSLELTFLSTVFLIIFSIYPVKLISRYINNQIS